MGELSPQVESITSLGQAAVADFAQPVVLQYFDSLNAGDFEATSRLFAVDGALQPPFENAVVGPEAIADYLKREARGFLLEPTQAVSTVLDDGCTEVEVVGKVQTPWFSVNVRWTFILSPTQQIFIAKINLLAALQDLLHLKNNKNAAEV
ncbi:MAG: nuclear transport factor 2 family protein [Oscillatoriales cyanobacterium C42_A2020_001]|nr:nuclear transport factor 2 family protein [Leptolyngbyaceae cyanobacterium C42_A2020_001]